MQKRILLFFISFFLSPFLLQADLLEEAFEVLPEAFRLKDLASIGKDTDFSQKIYGLGYAVSTMYDAISNAFGIDFSKIASYSSQEIKKEIFVDPEQISTKEEKEEEEEIIVSKPSKKVSTLKQISLSLDQWWQKGSSKSAFVVPYYVESGTKYYILGNEDTASGWAPFGGKCDQGESALTNAAREFMEEAGVMGGKEKIASNKSAVENRLKAADVYLVNTGSNNLIAFYFVEWRKDDIQNAFKDKDGEMSAFGSISEDQLKNKLNELPDLIKAQDFYKGFDTMSKSEKNKIHKKKDDFIQDNSKGLVELFCGSIKKDGFRGVLMRLSEYLNKPYDSKLFKQLSTGEIVRDSTIK